MQRILETIQQLLLGRISPLVVAIDGASGAGKSTIAAMLKSEPGIAIVPLDDFFAAHIPDHKWDEFTIEEKLNYVNDWERVRAEVVLPLQQGQPARWHAFDFQAGLRADGTYGMEKEVKECHPAPVILVEGAYSSSPALADLVDFSILVDTPLEQCHVRIALREDPEFLQKWHERWDEVEGYYFSTVRPRARFDLIIDGME